MCYVRALSNPLTPPRHEVRRSGTPCPRVLRETRCGCAPRTCRSPLCLDPAALGTRPALAGDHSPTTAMWEKRRVKTSPTSLDRERKWRRRERARTARGSVTGVTATAVKTLRSPWRPVSHAHSVSPQARGSYLAGGGRGTSTKMMRTPSGRAMWPPGESTAVYTTSSAPERRTVRRRPSRTMLKLDEQTPELARDCNKGT